MPACQVFDKSDRLQGKRVKNREFARAARPSPLTDDMGNTFLVLFGLVAAGCGRWKNRILHMLAEWIERSESHHGPSARAPPMAGFAAINPSCTQTKK